MQQFKKGVSHTFSGVPMKQRFRIMQKHMEQGYKAMGKTKKVSYREAKECYRRTYEKGTTFINDTYQVTLEVGKEICKGLVRHPALVDKMEYLSIKRIDRERIRNWSDLQQIKNMICEDGENRFAIEIFPPENQLMNCANQYHLWVFPPDFDIGLGYLDGRNVIEKKVTSTTKIGGIELTAKQG